MATNLILGNGLLGAELVRQTGWDCVPHKSDIGFDVLCPWRLHSYLKGHECLVNCTGYTKYHGNRPANMAINFQGAINLVNYCNTTGKRYVHISTDIVYAGSVPFATEEDVPVHAPNWYAYSKLLADGYVQQACTDYLLIRTAFKPRPFPFPVAFDKYGNFDYVDIIAGLIVKLIESDAKGVYNVGTHAKTMLNHARETVPDIELDAKYPLVNVSMNITKMHGVLHGK